MALLQSNDSLFKIAVDLFYPNNNLNQKCFQTVILIKIQIDWFFEKSHNCNMTLLFNH